MTRPINVAVLGATGSVGRQALDVIDRNPGRFKLFGLTEGTRSTNRQAEYVVQGQAGEPDFDARLEAMVTDPRCDIVVVAIPGARALAPTMAALRAGKEVALATKEVLVMAGHLVMKLAGEKGIRPVDSEHSEIWQCLWGEERETVRRLRLPDAVPPTSIKELSGLEFYELDEKRFPSVRLARKAAAAGGGHPAVLNAANEEAVNAFLAHEIPFSAIVRTVERALSDFPGCEGSLEEILEADSWARGYVRQVDGIRPVG